MNWPEDSVGNLWFIKREYLGEQYTQGTPLERVGSGDLSAIAPGASTTIDIGFVTAASISGDWNLGLTLIDSQGKEWEDAVPVRFYTEPLVLTASAGGDLPLCLISPTGMAHQFYFESPVNLATLSVPRAAGWVVGIAGAKAGSGFAYSLGASCPALTLDVLGLQSVDHDSGEPGNNSAAGAVTLPDYKRVVSWLGSGDLDFYAVDSTPPTKMFPIDEVLVDGGTFMMGGTVARLEAATEDYSPGLDTYGPVHEVSLDSFYMTTTELTWGQSFENTEYPYLYGNELMKPSETFMPLAMGITWYNAAWLCDQISRAQGLTPVYNIGHGNDGMLDPNSLNPNYDANGWRLPTEAEWEYAARGGQYHSDTKYAGSDTLAEVGWYGYGNDWAKGLHVVGMKKANALGLYDMSGNVSEWVNDWFPLMQSNDPSTAYDSGPQTNPMGPARSETDYSNTYHYYKVVRGGSVFDDTSISTTDYAAVKARSYNAADWEAPYIGFRMVRRAATP